MYNQNLYITPNSSDISLAIINFGLFFKIKCDISIPQVFVMDRRYYNVCGVLFSSQNFSSPGHRVHKYSRFRYCNDCLA